MKYDLRYLPIARQDILEIVAYISDHLSAPEAALNFLTALEKALLNLQEFPYACRVYQPIKPLQREYRMLLVKNYVVFYVVLEEMQTVEVQRVLYGKRNFQKDIL